MSGTLPHLPDHIAMSVFDVFQIPYSAVQREHEDLITAAAGGRRGHADPRRRRPRRPRPTTRTGGRDRWACPRARASAAGQTSSIDDLLGDMSRIEFVLRFTLSHPGLSTTIVGTSSPDHLRGNLAIAEQGPLPADLYEKAKERLAAPAASGLSGGLCLWVDSALR